MYSADTLKHNNKVYYFKRLFKADNVHLEAAFKRGYNVPYQHAAGQGINGIQSSLQLFSFDLDTNEECKVTGYYHEEEKIDVDSMMEDDEDDTLEDEYKSIEEIILLLNNCGIVKKILQFNITFSKPFGAISNQEFRTEEDFLMNQYYTYQQYVLFNEVHSIKIFKLGKVNQSMSEDLYEDQDDERLIVNTANDFKNDQQYNANNRQVQEVNHHQDYRHKTPTGQITFMIQNMFAMMQIIFDPSMQKKAQSIETFQRQQTDKFQKIWYNNGIQVQKVKIEKQNDQNKTMFCDQYFFYDNKNQIQVLWPNYVFKVDRLKCQELIAGQTGTRTTNLENSKKIVCLCQDSSSNDIVNSSIVFQKFHNLVQILNLPKTIPHTTLNQMTFCSDNQDNQILYIMDTEQAKIMIRRVQERETVICNSCENNDLRISLRTHAILQAKQKNQIRTIMQKVCCGEDRALSIFQEKSKNKTTRSTAKQLHQLQPHETVLCNVCDEDYEQSYLSYQDINEENLLLYGSIENIPIQNLNKYEKINHVYINDFYGKKVKVRTYNENENLTSKEAKVLLEQIRLIYYQPNNLYHLFIFLVYNKLANMNSVNDEMSKNDSKDYQKSYIFVRKTIDQMKEIFDSRGKIPIIKGDKNEEIKILKSVKCLQKIRFGNIREYQLQDPDALDEIDDSISNNSVPRKKDFYPGEQFPYIDIKLDVSKITDDETYINFIPLIYQEKYDVFNNQLIVFDIMKNQFEARLQINHGQSAQKYLYLDEQFFNRFTMCRVSDVYEGDSNDKKEKKISKQWAKYQIFALYTEKLGRFGCQEYLIMHDEKGVKVQTIGIKNLLISNQIINSYDWVQIRDSQPVPFYDECGSIKGAQFVMKLGQNLFSSIDLKDQDKNNIYKYQSDIIFTGRKKFIIRTDEDNEKTNDKFVMVASTQFCFPYIEKDVFTACESFKILRQMNLLTLGMRSTDLKYLIMNDFEKIKRKDFFRCQELLLGKSFMDVCLSDPIAIFEALKYYQHDSDDLGGSILHEITLKDSSRKETLKEIELYPKTTLLNFDLNHVGTIQRAIEQRSYKSLNTLVEYFFENINTFDYYQFIMHDLREVLQLENRQFEINEFFDSCYNRATSAETCSIEIKFKNNLELPSFYNKKEEYIKIYGVENFHNVEQEVSQKINEKMSKDKRSQKKCLSILRNCCFSPDETTYEIQHRYIDFQPLVIGQKIKYFDPNSNDKIKFNNIFYSKFMINNTNIEFYLMDSVQKFIDFQWSQTYSVWKYLFYMYMYMFIIPVTINLFSKSEILHYYMMNVATFPMIILTFIEIVQMQAHGRKYFQGWNFLDLTQIFVFFTLQVMRFIGVKEEAAIYIPELQLFQICLAFIKLTYFIRVFENYGFLIFMLQECIYELFPFIMTYILLIGAFSIFYVILNYEIDPEVQDAQSLSYFAKMIIQVSRTSFGELSMPMYSSLLKRQDSIFKTINLILIWLFWSLQVFFILVVMTNFLIAVITTTYDRVMKRQKIVSYLQKAELNEECFLLKQCFYEMQQYNIVALATWKEPSTLQNPRKELGTKLKSIFTKEFSKTKDTQVMLKDLVNNCRIQQKKLETQFEQGFNQILLNQDNLKQSLTNKIQFRPNN